MHLNIYTDDISKKRPNQNDVGHFFILLEQ